MPQIKHIQMGAKNITTPSIIASYRIKDYPRAGLLSHPWEMTSTQAVLVNAYDLLSNPRTRKYTDEIRAHTHGLHGYINFNGPVILDSGAYNFLKNDVIGISPADVLNMGIEMQTDLSVVLDHPFPPDSSPDEIQDRWQNTLRNTRQMYKLLEHYTSDAHNDFQLMPVLHGHNAETLERALSDLVNFLGREPSVIGIGSLAPLAQNGSKYTAIDVLLTVRRLLPDAYIHCFSMGSALLMLLAFYCGADTVDSQTWILSAAFKQAQMPGYYITRLSYKERLKNTSKYERKRDKFAEHLLALSEDGYCVKDWHSGDIWSIRNHRDATEYVDQLEDTEDENQVHNRACHNLYSFNYEAAYLRNIIRNGNKSIEEFIRSRVSGTKYVKVFEYAVEQKDNLRG